MSDQCTGPFSDAKDCPVHSKDVKGRLYTESELAAERSALLREALNIALRYRHGPINGVDLESAILATPTDQSALARVVAAAVREAVREEAHKWCKKYAEHDGGIPLDVYDWAVRRCRELDVASTDQSAFARIEAAAYERGKRDAKITIADLSRHPISYALGIVEEAIDALQDRGREAEK